MGSLANIMSLWSEIWIPSLEKNKKRRKRIIFSSFLPKGKYINVINFIQEEVFMSEEIRIKLSIVKYPSIRR